MAMIISVNNQSKSYMDSSTVWDMAQSAFLAAAAAAISTLFTQLNWQAAAAIVATAPVRDFITVFMSNRRSDVPKNKKMCTMVDQAAAMVRGDMAVMVGTTLLWTILTTMSANKEESSDAGLHAFLPAILAWLATAALLSTVWTKDKPTSCPK
jgi:hydrogenase-4 membrane subunit HyfE